MWVSGSLIRSSTWRSSSVSAPCISSSICLPSSPREVAHDARQLLPGIADRLHPRLHDAFLQLGGDVGEPLQRHLELGVLVAAGDLQQLVAGQHQLRDHGHQVFQRIDIDADRLVGDLVALLHLALDRCRLGAGSALGLAGLAFGSAGFAAGLARGRRRLGCGEPGAATPSRATSDRGLAEGALQFVQRHFARTQRPLQSLLDQHALASSARAAGATGRRQGHRRRRPTDRLAD